MTYKNIILDDSILDVDSWFPQEAIDEIVEIIKTHAKTPIEMQSFKNSQYKLETFDKKNFSGQTLSCSWCRIPHYYLPLFHNGFPIWFRL